MIATILLSLLIFGSCALIIFRTVKKGSSCEDCKQTDCAVKTLGTIQKPPHLS